MNHPNAQYKSPYKRVCFSQDIEIDAGMRIAANKEGVPYSQFLRHICLRGFKDYLIKKQEGIQVGF